MLLKGQKYNSTSAVSPDQINFFSKYRHTFESPYYVYIDGIWYFINFSEQRYVTQAMN